MCLKRPVKKKTTLFIGSFILGYLIKYMKVTKGCGEYSSVFLPCSNLCCKCLWTCQNLLFSPEGHSPPNSSLLQDHDGQSAGMPGRSSPLRSDSLCEASGTDPAPRWSEEAAHLLGLWHLVHGLWGDSFTVIFLFIVTQA